MKQFTLVFPKNKAFDFASWSFTNEVRVILSWLEGGDFFATDKLTCICQASDEKITVLQSSEWKQFIKANQ